MPNANRNTTEVYLLNLVLCSHLQYSGNHRTIHRRIHSLTRLIQFVQWTTCILITSAELTPYNRCFIEDSMLSTLVELVCSCKCMNLRLTATHMYYDHNQYKLVSRSNVNNGTSVLQLLPSS